MSAVVTTHRSEVITHRGLWLAAGAVAVAVTVAVILSALSASRTRPAVPDPISRIYSSQLVTGTGPDLAEVGSRYVPAAGAVTGTGPGLSFVGIHGAASAPEPHTPAAIHARNLGR